MNRTEIKEKVITIIARKFDIDITDILEKSNLIADLQSDSLDMIDFVMTIEHVFSVSISDEDIEKWATVGNIIDYLEAILNE